jgi:D-xylose transport system permease protein
MTASKGLASGHEGLASDHEGTVGDQLSGYVSRLKQGEMGALPAVLGFVILSIMFAFLNPYFLSDLNVANLLTQTATLLMLASALTFVILLAEIDLSAGVTSGVGMGIYVLLVNQFDVNWIIALLAAFAFGALVGAFIGYFVAFIGVPSFIVTLGLFLGFQGLMLVILTGGSIYRIETPEVLAIMNNTLSARGGWALFAVILMVVAATSLFDRRRRANA